MNLCNSSRSYNYISIVKKIRKINHFTLFCQGFCSFWSTERKKKRLFKNLSFSFFFFFLGDLVTIIVNSILKINLSFGQSNWIVLFYVNGIYDSTSGIINSNTKHNSNNSYNNIKSSSANNKSSERRSGNSNDYSSY